jgi:hypothetical protein
MLAVVDLPPVAGVDAPWVGTAPRRARTNPAATLCDQANFVRAGAQPARTRTFLAPQARLPSRFGLATTVGVFPTARAATALQLELSGRMAGCEDENLGTAVQPGRPVADRRARTWMSTWEVETELSDQASVVFRVGLVRVANRVAEVGFAPTGGNDMTDRDFAALVRRAGARLGELR